LEAGGVAIDRFLGELWQKRVDFWEKLADFGKIQGFALVQ
jgi:hypothetical protein